MSPLKGGDRCLPAAQGHMKIGPNDRRLVEAFADCEAPYPQCLGQVGAWLSVRESPLRSAGAPPQTQGLAFSSSLPAPLFVQLKPGWAFLTRS